MIKINTERLHNLLVPFYNVTGVKVAIYDTEFNEIVSYPKNDSKFCTKIRNHPVLGVECDKSTEVHCKLCSETKKIEIRQCHAGLTEVVAPITDGVFTIGYIMFGQISNIKDKEVFYQTILDNCKKYNLDEEELLKDLKEIRYYSDRKANDIAKIVNVIASYVAYEKIVQQTDPPVVYLIMDYIKKNIDKEITLDSLSKHFYISKSNLYKITKPYMEDGVAKFVKKLKLEKAADLLKNTDKSICKIAKEIGYKDVEYFQRVFKKEYGISSLDFRKNNSKTK